MTFRLEGFNRKGNAPRLSRGGILYGPDSDSMAYTDSAARSGKSQRWQFSEHLPVGKIHYFYQLLLLITVKGAKMLNGQVLCQLYSYLIIAECAVPRFPFICVGRYLGLVHV